MTINSTRPAVKPKSSVSPEKENKRSRVDWRGITDQIKQNLPYPTIHRELFPKSRTPQGNFNCPFCNDTGEHFQLNPLNGYCHKEQKSYDIFSAYAFVHDCDFRTAQRALARRAGVDLPTRKGKKNADYGPPDHTFPYYDESGTLLMEVVRWDNVPKANGKAGKKILQRRPDGNGGHIWKVNGVPLRLFRLQDILKASPGDIIQIHEGEKAVLAACDLGFNGTCNPMGGKKKWLKQCREHKIHEPLKDRIVWVFPDNDDDGDSHAKDVCESLVGFARSVNRINLPGLPPKGDVYDFVQIHGLEKAKEIILEIAEKTPEYVPDPNYKPEESEKTAKGPDERTKFQKVLDTFNATKSAVFLDQTNSGWTSLNMAQYRQNASLRSGTFRRYLLKKFSEEHRDGISRDLITQVADVLEANATEQRLFMQ